MALRGVALGEVRADGTRPVLIEPANLRRLFVFLVGCRRPSTPLNRLYSNANVPRWSGRWRPVHHVP